MRLFVAIELSDDVRRHLEGVQERLRPVAGAASWVKAPNLHLTLKFLGEVEDPRVPAVCAALEQVDAGRGLALSATGMECFPERGMIRVVGAKMEGDVAGLRQMVEQIEAACAELGFPREGRAYRPHVTLARARAQRPLAGALREEFTRRTAPLWPGPTMRAEGFVLMQSKLDAKGAEYTPVASYGSG